MGFEIVVGIIIAWAAQKGGKVARRVNGVTDRVVDQVWQAVSAELGADPAIQRLVTEARETGDAQSRTRQDAAVAVRRATERNPEFAGRLRDALPAESGGAAESASSGNMSYSGGVQTGDINAKRMAINSHNKITNKVVNRIGSNPLAAFVALVAAVALAIAVWQFWPGDSGGEKGGAAALAGAWTASDGTGTKTFDETGRCDGFYYNNGRPLDIGGPMFCTVGSSPDADGRYTLTVKQAPNQATYKIEFSGDQAVVYTSGGRELYRLSRA